MNIFTSKLLSAKFLSAYITEKDQNLTFKNYKLKYGCNFYFFIPKLCVVIYDKFFPLYGIVFGFFYHLPEKLLDMCGMMRYTNGNNFVTFVMFLLCF